MKFISPALHGVLDYLMCGFFLVIPSMYALTGSPALVCYLLAAGYLVISLCTNMPLGLFGWIPFWMHGGFELVSGFVFIASPWLFGFAQGGPAGPLRNVFIGVGVVFLLVYACTRWRPLPNEDTSAATT